MSDRFIHHLNSRSLYGGLLKGMVLACCLLVLSCSEQAGSSYENNQLQVPDTDDAVYEANLTQHAASRQALLDEYLRQRETGFQHELPELDPGESLAWTDVRRIVHENCIACHQPGGVGPFVLTHYKDLKKRSKTIRLALAEQVMPPWKPDEGKSVFFNAPELTMHERAGMVRWLEAGCPLDGSVEPGELAILDSAYVHDKEPDLVLEVGEAHEITTNGDSYQCFVLEIGNEEAIDISCLEYESTNPETIHHLMVFVDTTNGLADYVDGNACVWGEFNLTHMIPFDGWTKGMKAMEFTNDIVYRFPPGSRLILQIHYGDEGHKGKLERSSVRVYFAERKPDNRIVRFDILNKTDIFLPAGQTKVVSIAHKVREDMSILGLSPHMHYIARMSDTYAITPDGRRMDLIKFSDWDYLWQGRYMYHTPKVVPANSIIYCDVVFDNTDENPFQPNHPVRDVTYGFNSNDEMFVLNILYMSAQEGDEELRVGKLLYGGKDDVQ